MDANLPPPYSAAGDLPAYSPRPPPVAVISLNRSRRSDASPPSYHSAPQSPTTAERDVEGTESEKEGRRSARRAYFRRMTYGAAVVLNAYMLCATTLVCYLWLYTDSFSNSGNNQGMIGLFFIEWLSRFLALFISWKVASLVVALKHAPGLLIGREDYYFATIAAPNTDDNLADVLIYLKYAYHCFSLFLFFGWPPAVRAASENGNILLIVITAAGQTVWGLYMLVSVGYIARACLKRRLR